MWAIVVGLLVYIVAPVVTVAVFKKLFNYSSIFVSLMGLATGPLLVALIQYCLFAVLPGKDPCVYPLIISLVFLCLGVWGRKFVWPKKIIWRWPYFNIGSVYVGVVIMFVFVRMIMYPPIWGDVYQYIQQGYVYSQDLGLWRTNTGIPFTADSTHYVINPAIRPGLPMFYSLFFLVAPPTPTALILTHFVYLYYFVLLLFTVDYGGKLLGLKRSKRIWPVVFLISSFYLLRFTIFGAKEIILMELALLSLYALNELSKKTKIEWQYIGLMGMTMGLGSFLNFSGTLIALIMGFLFLIWVRYPLKLRLWATTTIISLTLIFGGFEPWNGVVNFIFSPTPLAQGTKTVDVVKLKQAELNNYDLKTNLDVLFRGKLQAFTQPQFFGFVYIIWLIILIVAWRKKQIFNHLEKLLLAYIGIYFLIIMDPFSLNPHPYAYVLAISPKYSLMLLPMLAVTMAGRPETVLYIQDKIPRNSIYYLGILIPLLFPGVRSLFVEPLMQIIKELMPLTNDRAYYLSLLNNLMVGTGVISLFMVITAGHWQRHYAKLAIIGLLILPTLFLLYSNFLR
ncbi:MAG: hypothetical protein UX37_C0002G0010 [Microgenomates group bacterium GW2011_GWA2_46_16]|nr:MAG: hypothetical protein UX37_C0002G0010 [Microgenomates group bacterium GW2011_GWA2_46_16]